MRRMNMIILIVVMSINVFSFSFNDLGDAINVVSDIKEMTTSTSKKEVMTNTEKPTEVKAQPVVVSEYGSDGYNAEGYNKNGFDRNGRNKEGYNWRGYDKNGFNKLGYNEDGFNKNGFDKEGYDKNGFDKNNIHRSGLKRNDKIVIQVTSPASPDTFEMFTWFGYDMDMNASKYTYTNVKIDGKPIKSLNRVYKYNCTIGKKVKITYDVTVYKMDNNNSQYIDDIYGMEYTLYYKDLTEYLERTNDEKMNKKVYKILSI